MISRSFSNAVTAVCRCLPMSVPVLCSVAATLACGASADGQPVPAVAPAAVAPAEAPAAGRHTARVTVPVFGRYAVEVASEQGASLELIDRMAGSLGVAGAPGTANGRLDVFLERGEYLAIVRGDDKARGRATLSVRASVETEPAPGPVLVEGKLLSAALDDHQQRSWWLRVGERRQVVLEAAGRALRDLRLWRDGSWLEPAWPRCAARQPVVGRPILDCQIAPTLEPGLYRLTAYGGALQAWSEGATSAPSMVLRWGIPRLPEAGRRRFVVSPFGSDRFLAPAATNFVRLELPASGTAELRVGNVLPKDPFFRRTKAEAEIDKTKRPWAAELSLPGASDEDWQTDFAAVEDIVNEATAAVEADSESSADEDVETESGDESGDEGSAESGDMSTADESGDGSTEESDQTPSDNAAAQAADRWIEVTGVPGQTYVLQQFQLLPEYAFSASGSYWVSTVQAGAAGDDADASGVVVGTRASSPRQRDEIIGSAALPLDAEHAFSRRFNLLGDVSLFFQVNAAGVYQIEARGAAARFRFVPFASTPPSEAKLPAFRAPGAAWDLNPGLYVLAVHPDKAGVLDLAVRPPGYSGTLLERLAGPGDSRVAARGEARFGALDLVAGKIYSVFTGERPDVKTGIVLRRLPLDLGEALPLALAPDDRLTLEGNTSAAGVLRLESEDGDRLPLAVDGGAPSEQVEVVAGLHTVLVAGSGERTRNASLVFVPAALRPEAPAEPLPQADLDALPRFPVLAPGAAAHLDLAAGERATYAVRADAPALYEIASTGLLSVAGTLRTRTVTELVSGNGNGVGTNFELRPYLGSGDYQLSVRTVEPSAGHLGLALRKTPLREGGTLRAGTPGRASLDAGEGIAYRFTIADKGTYRVRGAGDGFSYACRLEDADGWPVTTPGALADLKLELLPGDYRFVLLPRGTPAKALALFEKVEKDPVRKGHGPLALRLGAREVHVWTEPEEGQERVPDRFTFHLAAPATVTVSLDEEMQGRLERAGDAASTFVPPGRDWTGELAAGDYTLAVECSRRNNYVGYIVSVTPAELVAGMERTVEAPGEIAVSVGDAALTEIASYAPAGVRGVLLDASGRTVLRAPARPDDWSFLLSARLAPGRYRLRVDPVASGGALEVGLSMRSPQEVEERAEKLPSDRSLAPGDAVHLLPLAVGKDAELVVASLASKENVGCALEARDGAVWRALATATGHAPRIAAALDRERPLPLRLRVWSIDGRGETLRLRVVALAPRHVRESELRKGFVLAALKGLGDTGAAVVELDRPGVLRPAAGSEVSFAGGGLPSGLAVAEDGQWVALGRRALVVGNTGARLQAERVAATAKAPLTVRLAGDAAAVIDVAPATGPLLATARSLSVQPGIAAGGAQATGVALAVAPGTARAALSVAFRPAQSTVAVWNSGDAESGDVEVTVSRPALRAAKAAPWGVLEGVLDGATASPLDLPAGTKTVTLALGAGTAAAFADGDRIVSVHWQGGRAFNEVITTSAARLVLFHDGAEPSPYRIELQPAAALAAVRPLAPFESLLDRTGSVTVRVEAPKAAGWAVRVRGAEAEATFVGDDGRVLSGLDLHPAGAGTLRVRHGAGSLLSWIDSTAVPASPWSGAASSTAGAAAAAVPSTLALRGAEMRLRVPVAASAVLHLRTTVPVATVVYGADGAEVAVQPAGARLHALARDGAVDVALHALGGGVLSGMAELSTTPVVELHEGVNPPVLLAGGDRSYFAFDVPERRKIGVGVRADSSAVECELLTASGRSLGSGVLQLVDLEPGRYLLALGLPADAAPAAARPVIVGLVVPAGPPPDYVRPGLENPDNTTPEPAAVGGVQ